MLAGTIDKSTDTIELGKNDMLTVTLTASGDYGGTVNVATSLLDANNMPVTAVQVQAQPTAVVSQNGMVTVPVTVTVPSNATGTQLATTLKIDITGGPAPLSLTSAVTVDNIFTVIYPDGAGTDVSKHLMVGATVNVKRGATLRFKNEDTTAGIQHITHGGPLFPHETISSTSGLLGDVYDVPTTPYAPGSTGQLGCHDHESSATYITFNIQ